MYPAQTAGRLRHEPEWRDLPAFICAETIYHWIYTSAFALAEKRTCATARSGPNILVAVATAAMTSTAVITKLRPLVAHTSTFDNGSELARHEQITTALGNPVYFVDPYSSWQRGANENSKRQLRAYLLKCSGIRGHTQK
ncbi:IS30 family transposase [Candidatus Saccharibacteria bacterium]|nr:IS30 family transposase [Candidatus Saccharibacteria bacterium]